MISEFLFERGKKKCRKYMKKEIKRRKIQERKGENKS